MIRPPPSSPLFPSTTLSRSSREPSADGPPRRPAPRDRDPPPQAVGLQGRLAVEHRHRDDRGGLRRRDGLRHADLRSEEHTSELQSRQYLVCRLLLEKKKKYP